MTEQDNRAKSAPMMAEAEDPKAKLGRYNAIVDAAELREILLQRSQFEARPEYYKAKGEADSGEGKKLRFTLDWSADDIAFIAEDGVVVANFVWEIKAKLVRKQLLKCRCVFLCLYSGLKDQDEDAAVAFVKKVGRFATYPYFRGHVSQISWSSGADLPILPVLKEPKDRTEARREPTIAKTEAAKP